VLYMWATSPKLEEALQVINAWGFSYRTNAVWVKDKIGMGYYFRQQHELLLIASKGTLPTPLPSLRVSSLIHAPRLKHSQKPDIVAETLEIWYPKIPKLELFCRSPREGWGVWGNES
jgi:N6-adenosine-specific RNA methylase IME4